MIDWTVLVNPRAGRKPVNVSRITGALEASDVKYRLVELDSKEGMRHAAVDAAWAGRGVCVVGGDGTISLAVDSVLKAGIDRPVIAALPGGSGCDFLRTFGLHRSIEDAASRLLGDSTYEIDAGVIEGEFGKRHFVNVAQAGVGASAVKSAARLPRVAGSVRYPVAFGGRLPMFRACDVSIEPDQGESDKHQKALATIFSNSKNFAGGWQVSPESHLSDGLLDIQTFAVSKLKAPALVPRIMKGTHLGHSAIHSRSLESFQFTSEFPWPVEADGDYLGTTPIRVSTISKAIRWKI